MILFDSSAIDTTQYTAMTPMNHAHERVEKEKADYTFHVEEQGDSRHSASVMVALAGSPLRKR